MGLPFFRCSSSHFKAVCRVTLGPAGFSTAVDPNLLRCSRSLLSGSFVMPVCTIFLPFQTLYRVVVRGFLAKRHLLREWQLSFGETVRYSRRLSVEVSGPVDFKLYAASSAVDTDWTATLSDLHPDGQAIHVCEGIRGARFRDGLETPTLIEPGKVYEYDISLWETSYVFKAGHRIRLEVSSSNFPRFARNQNIGEPLGTSDKLVVANQTVYHNDRYPSHLVLPVIPAGSGQ